jgi:hypothetical protein
MFSRRSTLYVNRGNAHDGLGEWGGALADYDSALALDPSNAHAWRNKGLTFYRLHQLDAALRCFDTAVRANPRYGAAWISRADVLREAADTAQDPVPLAERAVLDYSRALALGSLDEDDTRSAFISRGFLEYHLHRFAQATADFTRGIQMRASVRLYLFRASSYADAGDRRRAMEDVGVAAGLARTPADSESVRETRDYVTRKQRAPQ